MSFESLGLAAPICQAVAAAGYTAPTPVQERVIPEALEGRDLMVSSQTGSGKTAAFMLPALQLLTEPHAVNGRGPRVLVLVPTRELSIQVTKAAETYGRRLGRVRTVSIVGGMPYPVQNRLLQAGAEIIVATPGRLLDQMQSGRVDLSRLQLLVLDEADRMLDMGFKDDLEAIVARMPAERQTVLFSATLDGNIARLAGALLRNPARIEIDSSRTRHENIAQRMHFADDLGHKNRLLDHVLRDAEVNQAIVFTATKRAAAELALDLHSKGYAVAALHGDMNQGARNRTLQALHGLVGHSQPSGQLCLGHLRVLASPAQYERCDHLRLWRHQVDTLATARKGAGHGLAVVQHYLEYPGQGLGRVGQRLFQAITIGYDAGERLQSLHHESAGLLGFFGYAEGVCNLHLRPACFRIALAVPAGISCFPWTGTGMVRPSLTMM